MIKLQGASVSVSGIVLYKHNSYDFYTIHQKNHNKYEMSDERKTYIEKTPKELEFMMQQAVLSRDAEDLSGFVTMFDESGNLCRQHDDGHSERINISGN